MKPKIHIFKTSKTFNQGLRRIFDDHSGEFDNFAGLSWDGHILVNEERCQELGYDLQCVKQHEIGHFLADSKQIPVEIHQGRQKLIKEFKLRHPENQPPKWAKNARREWLDNEIVATAVEVASCQNLREEYPALAEFGDSLLKGMEL